MFEGETQRIKVSAKAEKWADRGAPFRRMLGLGMASWVLTFFVACFGGLFVSERRTILLFEFAFLQLVAWVCVLFVVTVCFGQIKKELKADNGEKFTDDELFEIIISLMRMRDKK
jgi:hypothetical protein